MNRHSFIIFQILGIFLAFVAMAELAFSETSLNKLAIYFSVIAFIIPLFNPIRGYWVLVFLGCYLEMLKFGAWWQNARGVDMVVLNLPPIVAVAGICVGCLLMVATRRVHFDKTHLLLWGGTIVVGCLLGVKALKGGAAVSLGEAANVSVYLMLIPATFTLLDSKEQCSRLISTILICALPPAIYAIYQGLVGYPEWHYSFMEAYRNWSFEIDEYVQPVGTMNGAIALGTVCALCFCLVIIRAAIRGRGKLIDWLLAFTYLGASILSGRRSSLLLIAVFFMGLFFFKTPRRAFVLYACSGLAILSLYIFASPLIYTIDQLNREAERQLGSGTFVSRMANVGTFNERLLGFKNMGSNPDLWSFFGSEVSDRMGKFGYQGEDAATLKRQGNYEQLGDEFVHDGLNRAIISYGVIPILIAGFCGVVFLFKIHKAQFLGKLPKDRLLLKRSVALLIAVASLTLVSQQALTIQPINSFVFLWIGLFLVLLKCSNMENEEAQELEEEES